MKILARIFDERFLAHRQRSTSTAGILSAAAAIVLFEYRFFADHVANWDLAAIAVLFVVVKMSMMVWYAMRD